MCSCSLARRDCWIPVSNTNILVRNSRVHSVLVHVLSQLSTVCNKQYLVAQIALQFHCDGCVGGWFSARVVRSDPSLREYRNFLWEIENLESCPLVLHYSSKIGSHFKKNVNFSNRSKIPESACLELFKMPKIIV